MIELGRPAAISPRATAWATKNAERRLSPISASKSSTVPHTTGAAQSGFRCRVRPPARTSETNPADRWPVPLPGRRLTEWVAQFVLILARKELRHGQALLNPSGLQLLLHLAQPGLTPGHHSGNLAALGCGEA